MSINTKHFNKEYYLNICLGSEEFNKSQGRKINSKVKKMLDGIRLNPSSNVLEIGCGRGDSALYLARKVNSIIGIDYSIDAINIANRVKKGFSKTVQKKTKFYVMKADKLEFDKNSFDAVLLIDTIDHLSDRELEKTMKEISRVLKKGGLFFVKSCSNRIFLDYTYRYYIYPLNRLLTFVDKKIKKIDYDSLPKDPRTKEQKLQHVNEPSYKYLVDIFRKFNFEGKVESEIGAMVEYKGIRSLIYNFLVTLYPFSKRFPLNMFFSISFIGNLKNKKLIPTRQKLNLL